MEELQVIETTSGRQFKPWVDADKLQQIVSDPSSVTAVASEIASGKQAIASAINAKGGTASATESFSELAQAVEEIPNFDDMVKLASVIAGGNYNKNALQGHDENVKYGKTEIVDILGAFETINVSCCFQYWDLLERVTFSNVTTITDNVFNNCSSLQEVVLTNLTTIGNSAFSGCSSLREINMPNLTTIGGRYAFQNCPVLQELNMPNLTTISGSNTFKNATSLREVSMPNLTTISGQIVFENCFALRNLILGTLTSMQELFSTTRNNIRNITIGQDTNINLPFQQWTATNVIAEGQSGIDELNNNLYSNLLTKLYDHSQDGQTRTLRIGWLAKVSAENIAYANAKGWTLTT